MKDVRALIDGKPARSFSDVRPGAELSFDGEVRAGGVVLFGEERYRATRGEGGGVAFDRLACPACSSPKVIPILYGEPNAEGAEMIRRGERAMGGCLLGRESPAWSCKACGQLFGRLDEERPEMFKDKERSDG